MCIYRLVIVLVGLLLLNACATVIVTPITTTSPSTIVAACKPTPGKPVPVPTAIADELPSKLLLAKPNEAGERLIISGTVYAADCKTPLAGTFMEVWNANQAGKYTYLRGKLRTDAQGHFLIDTIKPSSYGIANHVHFVVYYPDTQPIATLLEFVGDPLLKATDTTVVVTDLIPGEENGKPLLRAYFDIVLADAKDTP